jgi:hypothetical protein
MAYRPYSLYPGGHATVLSRLIVDDLVLAGQLLARSPVAADPEEAILVGPTDVTHALGIAAEDVLYQSPNGQELDFEQRDYNTVTVLIDPFSVYAFPVSGGDDAGVPLTSSAEGANPANILTNATQDGTGTTVEDPAVGTVNMAGGLLIGKTGSNTGQIRKMTAHTDNVSVAVTHWFASTIQVGDQFIRLPFNRVSQDLTLTTDVKEVCGLVDFGAAADLRVLCLRIDTIRNLVTVHAVAGDHHLNGT